MANKCLFCSAALEQTDNPKEHIIPNAIGGRLKSRVLICSTCNSTFGQKCDASMAEKFNFFANFLDIKRERGEPQPIRSDITDSDYSILPGGKPALTKPEFAIKEIEGGKKVEIKARNMKEARQILEGMKKKDPSIDVDKILATAVPVREYVPGFIDLRLNVGGPDLLRAIAKMLYLFSEHKSPGLMKGSTEVAEFIKGSADYRQIYFYYPPVPFVAASEDQVLHTLLIKSYPAEKLLLGFVELFGVVSFVCVLSDNFAKTMEAAYVFDLLERREIITPQLNFPVATKSDLERLFKRLDPPFDELKNRFYWFLKLTGKRQTLEHLSKMAQRAVKTSLMRHPEGTPVTDDMIAQLIQAFEDELAPFIASRYPVEDEFGDGPDADKAAE